MPSAASCATEGCVSANCNKAAFLNLYPRRFCSCSYFATQGSAYHGFAFGADYLPLFRVRGRGRRFSRRVEAFREQVGDVFLDLIELVQLQVWVGNGEHI